MNDNIIVTRLLQISQIEQHGKYNSITTTLQQYVSLVPFERVEGVSSVNTLNLTSLK